MWHLVAVLLNIVAFAAVITFLILHLYYFCSPCVKINNNLNQENDEEMEMQTISSPLSLETLNAE